MAWLRRPPRLVAGPLALDVAEPLLDLFLGEIAVSHSDLSLADGAHVFATRAENDVIGIATHATLGPDPMGAGFGGMPFEAAPGPAGPFGSPTVDAHSSYWSAGNPAPDNPRPSVAGQTNVTPPRFTP